MNGPFERREAPVGSVGVRAVERGAEILGVGIALIEVALAWVGSQVTAPVRRRPSAGSGFFAATVVAIAIETFCEPPALESVGSRVVAHD